jgi:YVTN family beta-propeller protein
MGELPSGTVTFVFTDIEGSTRLLTRLRERYAELRDAHHRLLREAFAGAGGQEMGTEGDAFFVAFSRAKDAVTAAVAAQRALAAHPWPPDAEIRVRMGIHTGEPEVDEEGYLGLALHRVARISAAGHGGQVLLSNTTREIVEDDLPHDVALRDLGEQRFKDFDRPQWIFQLVIDGLPAEFPPLKTVSAADATAPFAGREDELEAAARTVAEHPWYLRRRRLMLSALAGVIAAAVSIPVFALGRGSSGGGVLSRGSAVVVLDAKTNEVVDSLSLGAPPADVVKTSGAVWVATLEPSAIYRIDPHSAQIVRPVQVRRPPSSLAAGFGAVWAVSPRPDGTGATVQRIDARPSLEGLAKEIEVGGEWYGSTVGAVAAGEGGVWVVPAGVGPVARVDPRTNRSVDTIDPGSCCPSSVAAGGGAVWVADRHSGQVARIDGVTGLVKPIAVGNGPSGVAVGEGGVWVAIRWDDEVTRIDPATGAVRTTIEVGHGPIAVAIGGGAVWVANSGDGTVSRIDPEANRVVDTVDIGGSPQRLVYEAGKVWVSVQQAVAETARTGGTARFNAQEDVGSLDPALAYAPISSTSLGRASSPSWQIEYATCAKLVNYPDRPGAVGTQLVPEVAQSLPRPTNGGRTYTFRMRRGFRFSPPSGRPVTAQAFKHAIERSLSPEIAGPARLNIVAPTIGVGGALDDVVGAKAYEAGRAKHISGIVANGNMLSITLVAPAPDLLARLTMPFFCAVPADTPVRPVQIVATAGPYYVASYSREQIVLRRNPNYRGPRPHHLERIEITIGVARTQTVAQIEGGRVDYAVDGTPPTAAKRLEERYGLRSVRAKAGKRQFFNNPTPQTFYLAMNTSRPPFSDLKMRRAVNYAIDRALLASLTAPLFSSQATDQYLPPGMPGFRDKSLYPVRGDPAKASRLMGGRSVKAVLYSCTPCAPANTLLKGSLSIVGIDVEPVEFPSFGTLRTKLGRRGEPFDLGFVAWSADYLDPAGFLNVLLSGKQIRPTQNFNISYFDSPDYNRKLAAAARLSGRARYAAYAKLDVDLAGKAAPMVALVNLTRQDFFSARMGCQVYNPLYGMDIAALCLRK